MYIKNDCYVTITVDHGKTSTISIFKTFIEHFYGYLKVITKTIWMRVKLANVHWTIFQIVGWGWGVCMVNMVMHGEHGDVPCL